MALPARRNDDSEVARWDPFAELSRLNHQMQRYVDNWRDLPSIFGEGFAPLADVEETDDAFVPADLDEDGVSAELDEGVLIVRVPKAASERPRRITV